MVRPDFYNGVIAEWYDDWTKDRTFDIEYWKDEIVRLLNETGFSRVEFLTDAPEYEEGSVFWIKARG